LQKFSGFTRQRLSLLLLTSTLLIAPPALAFQQGPGATGCAAGDCRDCHSLERKEVADLIKVQEKDILNLTLSEVPGLWEVEVLQQGKTFPLLIDFSKEFVIPAKALRIAPPKDPKKAALQPPKVISPAQIPLDDALLIGKANATRKIIVFDDPECQFCAALQPEMQTVVKNNPDVAFLIKMFPLTKIHPTAYEKARAIVCGKSVAMLEDSLAGKTVPPPICDTDQVKRTLELGRSLGISSTPTLIMPDGRVFPGSKTADDIIRVLNGEEPLGVPKPAPSKAEVKGEAKAKPTAETKKSK
jgi:thiol:disulfide interchange protein DsbC